MYDLSQFPLHFGREDLAPYMSRETIDFHYGRHLATYIKNTNDLIAGTEYESLPLVETVRRAFANNQTKLFNNSAQVFNHNFFFQCLCRNGGGMVPDEIAAHFGGADSFRQQFKDAALSVFGSGWTWLVLDDDKIKIINTANADTPIVHGMRPLMCIDVWEHAYYLDYQNRRAEYIDAFLDKILNWDFVLNNMK